MTAGMIPARSSALIDYLHASAVTSYIQYHDAFHHASMLQRPENRGGRFSMNARRPSSASPLSPTSTASWDSRAIPASQPYRIPRLTQRFDAATADGGMTAIRSEEHTSELQSRLHLVCRLLLEKKKSRIRSTVHS